MNKNLLSVLLLFLYAFASFSRIFGFGIRGSSQLRKVIPLPKDFKINSNNNNKFGYDGYDYEEGNNPRPQGLSQMDSEEVITERLTEIDSAQLSKSDVQNYGVCAVLAQEHLWLGNLAEAEQKALEAIEAASHTTQLDGQNVYQAYAEGILAEVLYKKGNYKEAADSFHHALLIYEKHTRSSTGPESVMLVAATQLISWLSLTKNESTSAQHYCKTALSMTERLLGPSHSDVGISMVNLAAANFQGNDFGKSTEGLLCKALDIFEISAAGNGSKKMILERKGTLNLLAKVYFLRVELESAQLCLLKVVDLYNSGELEGIEVVDEMKMLGDTYVYENDFARAKLYYNKALSILEKSSNFGSTHPKTLTLNKLVCDCSTDRQLQ